MAECTKIAHRRSLAIFIADEGIAGNSAARIIFTPFHRRRNRGSLAIFFAEEIAHLGASKSRAIFPGAVEIANRSRRESRDFGALSWVVWGLKRPFAAIPSASHRGVKVGNP